MFTTDTKLTLYKVYNMVPTTNIIYIYTGNNNNPFKMKIISLFLLNVKEDSMSLIVTPIYK